MNPDAQAKLDLILHKNPEDLTKEEIAFLRGRSPYLTNDQKRIYASVLDVSSPAPKTEAKTVRPKGWNLTKEGREELRKQKEASEVSAPVETVGQSVSTGTDSPHVIE